MARENVYTGTCCRHDRRNHNMVQRSQQKTVKNFRHVANLVFQYVGTAYGMVNRNYIALATVFAVVLLSFLIPDISQKIHATNELKTMKNVVNLMTEIAIMSYVYTDSFDAEKTMTTNCSKLSE